MSDPSKLTGPYRYYKTDTLTAQAVSYRAFDAYGTVLFSEIENQCFSGLTYNPIPSNVAKIEVTWPLEKIPYDEPVIVRWIDHISEMGFTNIVRFEGGEAVFAIDVAQYKWKRHLGSTLMLIRALWEMGVCLVPELYFDLLRKKRSIDKFTALQIAHKSIKKHEIGSYAASNHMITYQGKGDANITAANFWKKLENGDIPVYHSKYVYGGISDMWRP
jgi:hypothetical protein